MPFCRMNRYRERFSLPHTQPFAAARQIACRIRTSPSSVYMLFHFCRITHNACRLRLLVRELRDCWFKFFQKHQIWLMCALCHTVSIFAGRQDERPLAGRHFEKTNPKMTATSAQTCMIPLFRCSFGLRIRF